MPISKDQAIRIAIEHLIAGIDSADIQEGWPGVSYEATGEPVWALWVRSKPLSIGAARYIVISQLTGKVLADQNFGE